MIDFSMDEMLELARQAELQKRIEADDLSGTGLKRVSAAPISGTVALTMPDGSRRVACIVDAPADITVGLPFEAFRTTDEG